MDDKYRMDSATTYVAQEDGSVAPKDEMKGEEWRSSPVDEKMGLRFSFGHSSQGDDPYQRPTSRESKGVRSTSRLGFDGLPHEKPWRCGDPYRHAAPQEPNSWQKCRKMVDKYDDDMCAAWREEVDKLLIFAGLFSATITAFTVESYKWLRQEPEDTTIQLLVYLTTQLTNTTIPPELNVEPFQVSFTEARINALWFASLALSVTTVLIGILCMQWLREYQRDPTLTHKDAIALRQMRFEGLVYWRVPEILSFLPLLLQISLVLFFLGLLDLLWTHNQPVAVCLTVLLGIVLLFVLITTALPTLQQVLTRDDHMRVPQCPYKSPQSWIFYSVFNAILVGTTTLLGLPWKKTSDSSRFYRLLKASSDTSWVAFDMRWRRLRDASTVIRGVPRDVKDGTDVHDSLHWLNSTFTVQNIQAVHPLHSSLTSPQISISSAEQAISSMYLPLGQMDAATFRVMLDDRYSPTEAQKREVVSAFYLHLHYRGQDDGPSDMIELRSPYVETVVRILNSQDVPQPFYDWLSDILIEMSGRVVAVNVGPRTSRKSRLTLPRGSSDRRATAAAKREQLLAEDEELVVQVLMCVRGLITKDALRVLDIVMAWNLIYYLLYGFSDRPVASPPASAATSRQRRYLPLVLSIVDVLVGWLERGKERDRWERVKLCAEGVLKVFPPDVLTSFITTSVFAKDSVAPGTGYAPPSLPFHPAQAAPVSGVNVPGSTLDAKGTIPTLEGSADEGDIHRIVKLVRTLDEKMERMGGAVVVLCREKWWHDFWDSGFSEDDWVGILDAVGGYL